MAKLLVAMVNSGINVFVTTHSDFLIKEINNLILLNNDFPEKEKWLKKNKKSYTPLDKLDPKYVSIYQTENNTLKKIEVTDKGIEIPFFDEEISSLFNISTELEYLNEFKTK